MRFLRALLPAMLFCMALAGTCWGIRAAQPFPKVLGTYQKWLYFQRHKADIDTIFVGSSRVYHAIIPPRFDAAVTAATGKKLRSFNLGYDAMWPPESLFMVREILKMRSPRLHWVVLECLDIFADLSEETRHTRRTAYWHDVRHTLMTWEAIFDQGFAPLKSWDLLTSHGEILLRNLTSQGRGAEALAVRFGVERAKKATRWDPPDAWKNDEGYEPEDDKPLAGEELERFNKAVSERKKGFPPVPMKPSLARAYADIISEIRAAGCEPIILVTPTVRADENFAGLPAGTTVWSYHDPHEYPALYAPENRHDFTHLNHAGALVFTDLLSARFAELLKGQPR